MDIDECKNQIVCSEHGSCQNTKGQDVPGKYLEFYKLRFEAMGTLLQEVTHAYVIAASEECSAVMILMSVSPIKLIAISMPFARIMLAVLLAAVKKATSATVSAVYKATVQIQIVRRTKNVFPKRLWTVNANRASY